MAEDWDAIAAEVADAIASVGFPAQIEVRGETTGPDNAPTVTLFDITVIDDQIKRRDGNGMVTETVRVLTMAGNGTVPLKGWRVLVRGQYHRIARVMPLAPGGTDLLFDVELEG